MTIYTLLVEDSPVQAEYYKEILEEIGLHVTITDNGLSALDLAFTYLPDLIVLDINLPELNGFQVCHRLSRSPETKNIPVIMLTERDTAQDAVKGFEYGALKYIPKNAFASEALIDALQQLLIIESV